jgi:hypothetical protein
MTEQTIHQKIAERKAALESANRKRADLQALSILLENNGIQPAPNRIDLIAADYNVVTVGIGKDHTATILVTTTDLRALRRLLGEPDA